MFSFVLGGAGLATMAASGVARHGAGRARHATHSTHSHAAGSRAPHHLHAPTGGVRQAVAGLFWALLSPRVIFSLLIGFGATGLAVRRALPLPWALAAAAAGALALESLLVAPLWRFLLRFESRPALTLESALLEEARAVTTFDAHGQGLVAVELDGQVVQILATLRPEDRAVRVRAGDRLRIEDVEAERNRCIVAAIGPSSNTYQREI